MLREQGMDTHDEVIEPLANEGVEILVDVNVVAKSERVWRIR